MSNIRDNDPRPQMNHWGASEEAYEKYNEDLRNWEQRQKDKKNSKGITLAEEYAVAPSPCKNCGCRACICHINDRDFIAGERTANIVMEEGEITSATVEPKEITQARAEWVWTDDLVRQYANAYISGLGRSVNTPSIEEFKNYIIQENLGGFNG